MVKAPKGSLKCAHCGKYFLSIPHWWLHRVGPHDARRCLSTTEMYIEGFRQSTSQKWRWLTPDKRGPLLPRHYTVS